MIEREPVKIAKIMSIKIQENMRGRYVAKR